MNAYGSRAALLKAIGHPTRLQIVDLLQAEPECVCHLAAALGRSQPYVSQQLAILRNAGVIVDERDGTNIFYRLADDSVVQLVAAACSPYAPSDVEPGRNGRGRHALVSCTCPKCLAAHGKGAEACRVAC